MFSDEFIDQGFPLPFPDVCQPLAKNGTHGGRRFPGTLLDVFLASHVRRGTEQELGDVAEAQLCELCIVAMLGGSSIRGFQARCEDVRALLPECARNPEHRAEPDRWQAAKLREQERRGSVGCHGGAAHRRRQSDGYV